jgi:hypothetical protein
LDVRDEVGRPVGPALVWPWVAGFVVVSTLDWLLTRALVEGGVAVEANPLAAWVLRRYGWAGLAYFKASLTAATTGLGLVIYRRSRLAAQRLLRLACAAVVLVVGYGLLQLAQASPHCRSLARAKAEGAALEGDLRHLRGYGVRLDELARQVIAGRLSLAQATDKLAAHVAREGYAPPFMRGLAVAEGLGWEGCLAVHLVCEVGHQLHGNPAAGRRVLSRLRAELTAFGVALPGFALHWFPGWEMVSSKTVPDGMAAIAVATRSAHRAPRPSGGEPGAAR